MGLIPPVSPAMAGKYGAYAIGGLAVAAGLGYAGYAAREHSDEFDSSTIDKLLTSGVPAATAVLLIGGALSLKFPQVGPIALIGSGATLGAGYALSMLQN